MGFAHISSTLAGAKASPRGAAGLLVRDNDDGVEPEGLQCMEQLSAAGLSSFHLSRQGACGRVLHSGGRHSSLCVMVLQLHALL